MISLPKISIVTPSYSQGKFLENAILSVLEQGYPNLEYIIIDGGSSDESVEIIKKYADRLAYWVSEPDRGQSHAINKGFERATGEIFGWLNSDDWYHPGALQSVAEAFAANPDAGAVVGAGEMTDGTSSCIKEPFAVTVDALYCWIDKYFMQPSCFFTKKAWDDCGPLSEELNFAMDLNLWLAISSKFDFAFTDIVLSASLVHANAKTTAFAAKSIAEAAMVISSHGGGKQIKSRMEEFIQNLYENEQRLVEYHNMLSSAHEEISEISNSLRQRDQHISNLDQHICVLDHRINELINSASWKLTAPLRKADTLLQNLKNKK